MSSFSNDRPYCGYCRPLEPLVSSRTGTVGNHEPTGEVCLDYPFLRSENGRFGGFTPGFRDRKSAISIRIRRFLFAEFRALGGKVDDRLVAIDADPAPAAASVDLVSSPLTRAPRESSFMLRPVPLSPLRRLRWGLRRRLRRASVDSHLRPVRMERMSAPAIRMLEPRVVLDASAALSMGELLVMGTDAAETVQLQVDSSGDLLLKDGAGNVIEIDNHPDGPGGTRNPLDPSAITSGQIVFSMGAGNDSLDLELPSGLDVTVEPGDDLDTTNLRFSGGGTPDLVRVDSERITIDTTSPLVSIADDTVQLKGNVFSGIDAARSVLDIGAGQFQVEGVLTLTGDVTLVGPGTVDLSAAVITASTTDTSLRVDLQARGDFLLGGASAVGGELIEDLIVASANSVTVGPAPLSLSGDFFVRDITTSTQLDSAIEADSVSVVTNSDIAVEEAIRTRGGEILLSTSESLSIGDDLNTAFENRSASINLFGRSVQLADAQITTAGGLVNVSGPVQISGDVSVDSGNAMMANSAGRVQFFDAVQGADAVGDTLRIDSRGASLDGAVRFQAAVGGSSMLPATDLNGLDVQAGQIEVDTIGVRDGDVSLSADVIRLFGHEMRTSVAGNILVRGGLLLPTGDTTISAAEQVQFTSTVKGQSGTLDLRVTAGTSALFEDSVDGVRNFDVDAGRLASFSEGVFLAGDLTVKADTIRIHGDVDTTFGDPDGNVSLLGSTLVLIDNDAVVFVGNATIQVDPGGGLIDTRGATLRSDSAGDDAIILRNASRVMLGNVIASRGNLTIGVDQDVRGTTDQAEGTAVQVDRLTADTDGSIDLSNAGNQFRSIERITSGGDITIQDSQGDLTVAAVDSRTNDVVISTAGNMFLAENAVTALAATAGLTATTTLSATRGIFDRDDTIGTNIRTDRLQLNAGTEGIGTSDNPVDVVATSSANATAARGNGDIALANIGGPLPIGLVDAGRGDVQLTAGTINDDLDDDLTDIIARRLEMTADEGIGNVGPLELLSVAELMGVTMTGGINLNLVATSETVVQQLAADAGDIVIHHRGSDAPQPVVLESVRTGDGAITILAEGTIEARLVVSENGTVTGGGGPEGRDVTLTAVGRESDILVSSVTASNSADVILVADDDILDSDMTDELIVTADDLQLTASNQTADQVESIRLTTNVNDLQARVAGENRGDIWIEEQGSINLASSDQQGDESIETDNGQIVVHAEDKITIMDTSPGDDGDDLTADPEIIARGENGRIDLEAVTEIELQDEVQLQSEKITQAWPEPITRPMPADLGLTRLDRSIYLESTSIVLGERIELNTGPDADTPVQGVARAFAPRPFDPATPDDVMPAFFDPGSVTTNVLEQALFNDATGILTLDIGQTGERGLTVDIDWGAPSIDDPARRFQQISGLSADVTTFVGVTASGELVQPVTSPGGAQLLSVAHFYREVEDIFDSRENGRASSTDPLEVRFSVRHHESILVIGNTVRQGSGMDNQVPGIPGEQIVSSTDDPNTPRETLPGLESGEASFLIPSLSIPVAFFPVREVIPEIEVTTFVVRSETPIALTQNAFETVESTSSSIVGREEYFQIRVLSPDPDGEDLAVRRLPDDILEGDKIQKLLEELPDGSYEIEYVLGDANQRSILRVDIRGGEATIPGEELDEGGLKLNRPNEEKPSGEKPSEEAASDEAASDEAASDEAASEAEPIGDEDAVDKAEPTQPELKLPSPDAASLPPPSDASRSRTAALPPLAIGVAATSVLRRRLRSASRGRLSAAGRFAARTRARQET